MGDTLPGTLPPVAASAFRLEVALKTSQNRCAAPLARSAIEQLLGLLQPLLFDQPERFITAVS